MDITLRLVRDRGGYPRPVMRSRSVTRHRPIARAHFPGRSVRRDPSHDFTLRLGFLSLRPLRAKSGNHLPSLALLQAVGMKIKFQAEHRAQLFYRIGFWQEG